MARYKPSVKELSRKLIGCYNVRRMSTVGSYLHNEFVACLLNVETRIHSCEVHSNAFSQSIEAHINALPSSSSPEEDFIQDHHLFGFFFNGLAGLESAIYGFSIMIGMSFPTRFPLVIPNTNPAAREPTDLEPWTLRELTIKDVAGRLRKELPNDQLTDAINQVNGNDIFNSWSDVRNIFSHRGIPNRKYYIVHKQLLEDRRRRKEQGMLGRNELRQLASLERNNRRIHVEITDNFPLILNGTTTTRRLEWLDKTLRGLMVCGLEFLNEHHPKS